MRILTIILLAFVSLPVHGQIADYKSYLNNKGEINPVYINNAVRDLYNQKLDASTASGTYLSKSSASATYANYNTTEDLYLRKSSASTTYANYGTTEELYLRKSSATATYATKTFMGSFTPKSNDTKYEALTDGVVAVYIYGDTSAGSARATLLIGATGDVDSGKYATCADMIRNDKGTYPDVIELGGFTCPVNAGQFWKVVTAITGTGNTVTTRWISFGD